MSRSFGFEDLLSFKNVIECLQLPDSAHTAAKTYENISLFWEFNERVFLPRYTGKS